MTRVKRAKAGKISGAMRDIARREYMDPTALLEGVIDGSIVVIQNDIRKCGKPFAIGSKTRIKVNANIGTSSACARVEDEIAKMKVAVASGADAIMDLSIAGDLKQIRREILNQCTVPVGTVPIYEMASNTLKFNRPLSSLTADEMFNVIEEQCEQGVDFMTLHCGVTQRTVELFRNTCRLAGAVSRGGTILMEWIIANGKENPLYEHYDRLLKILAKHDVALSLGDAFRPGALKDATDAVQIEELIVLGDLVRCARERNVGVFVEGPGHVPLNMIATNVQIQKTICHNAPFYVLGPLVTDISPGYDHISAAIGGAVAGMAGADFLCYVTPAEHLRLPSIDDVREGVIAARIAAHAADIARGFPEAMEWDNALSKAKVDLDWKKMISLCIDPEKAQKYRQSLPPTEESVCSMCGEFCAIKRSKAIQKP